MEISANILAQMRKNCAPERGEVQKKVSNFVRYYGGKIRPDFWAVFNAEYKLTHDVMVCVQPGKKVRILSVRRDRIFARHVGELLKSCSLVWVDGTKTLPITWDNWKAIFRLLTEKRSGQVYDLYVSEDDEQAIRDARRKESDFYELAATDRYKKMGKRGYNLSFNEQRAVRRMEAAERQAYRTIAAARRIMEAL